MQKQPEDQDTEGEQKVLHFDSITLGSTAERQIRLYNPSVVRLLPLWVTRSPGGGDVPKTYSLSRKPSPTSLLSSLIEHMSVDT